MSQQHIDLWKTTAEAFDQRWQAVGDQWDAASPCDEWSVRELVDHTIGTQAQFTAGIVGAEIAEGAQWPDVKQAIWSALDTEGALDGMTNHPAFGEVPKAQIFGIAITDLLLHTWDVARAVGADEALPSEAVAACHQGLKHLPEEVRTSPGFFAPAIACAEDADAQTQLLSFAGRQV